MSLTAPISRRGFLIGTAMSGVLVAVPLLAAQPAEAATVRLTRATFLPVLNSTVQMSIGSGSLNVILAEIGDLSGANVAGDQHRFSLIFQAMPGPVLPQAVRHFSSPRLHGVDLFVVPIGRANGGQQYQVVVNSPR
ncbi:MAG: twin-arginine translocation signal domain-containing protein [Actinomycetota bacterium]|nr:twin-arginine translocation signal domain-containing protein [Actinomycetota bacterium]